MLGVRLRPPAESMAEMGHSVIKHGFVAPTSVYAARFPQGPGAAGPAIGGSA
jgi:hypothetical protein